MENPHARSSRLAGPGGTGQWVRAHDMRANGSTISRVRPHGCGAYFCHLIYFLHAWRKLRWPALVSNYSRINCG
jgi:hypothetical protein